MNYRDEVRSLRKVGPSLGEGALAALVALVVSVVGLVAFSLVEWPAFTSSNVTRALTTVGQFATVALLVLSIVLLRLRKWVTVAKAAAWVGLSGLVTVTLGMPLAATKFYLGGVSVDQEFRTEYLTRLTDSPALHDMTYIDLPPFYPAGWFWLGGRVGDAAGLAGWEVFKPYAIAVLAVGAVAAYVLWSRLVRADLAVGAAAAVTVMVLAYASPEAYSAVLIFFIPPVLILAWGGLHRRGAGGWGAVIGTGLFLGLAACFYTLYLFVAAFTVTLMAVVAAFLAVRRTRAEQDLARRAARHANEPAPQLSAAWRALVAPLVRLIVIAAISGALALVVWTPYLLKLLTHPIAESGTALHYLPAGGSELAFPMFEWSMTGALCLVGTVWLVVRTGTSRRAQALSVGVVSVYLWSLLSMAATAAGTTLLSFRLTPVLVALLAAAGVFGFSEGVGAVYRALNEPAKLRLTAGVLAALGAVAFVQTIPHTLMDEIDTAYADTYPTATGGERGDKRPPSAVSFYPEIDSLLLAQTGRPRDELVVLTADTTFLSFYPYFGFQSLTSHYANPLADFKARAALIDNWSKLPTSEALVAALADSPWRAPDAFLFRDEGDAYTLRLAEDVYPNDPNVRRYTVSFPKTLFTSPHFKTTQIGPFALVTVNR
ncbi:galactan 5-O-arabinofuranosyltransferase [Nocardia camponoti]|uniref:Galactan 5-O-arabinofuranosyltransferase n=1 Tax=Nocardia camponoti TaxID=1616106 RepID=A0A917QKU8_9NOCA|nr:galactan 5-O-arabinofuranosyltransferase [Nocardia camponoti]GGK55633.1 hypothetical protein GCM10011591_29560 [Nocardia camponoti]